MRVFVIAEAGVNHNGSIKIAKKLIDVAANAGADAVKFQTFKAENLASREVKKASYQKLTTEPNETQYEMLRRLELSLEYHHILMKHCNANNIDFLSTAFDSESLSFLRNVLKLNTFKIPSGEITNGPLLLEYARAKGKIVLSTGMSKLSEIEEALSILAFGYISEENENVSKNIFRNAFLSDKGQAALKEKVTLLHCTTEYPTPPDEINLNAMVTLRDTFGLDVGYSDHSEGIIVPIVAASLGATIIEKHFTISKELPGPDHRASLNPEELNDMINKVRITEKVLGNGIKAPTSSEIENRLLIRKSLFAKEIINMGIFFHLIT